MPPAGRGCWSTGCCGAASCRRRRSASCGISPALASGRFQAHTAEVQRVQRPWRTPASSWTRPPPTCWAPRVGRCWPPWLAGNATPEVLAELARGRLRTKLPQLRHALRGRFGDHTPCCCAWRLAHLEHLEGAIAALDRRVDAVIAPFAAARDRLDTITGWGSGPRRPSSPRSAPTWVCSPRRAPGLLGGALPGQQPRPVANAAPASPPRQPLAGEVLIECAWAAARSRDTYLSAQYWRLARRIGKQEGRRRRRPLHPGDRLAPAHQRLRLCRPRRRLLRPPRRPPRPPASRRPTPGPRLPRHPPTPRRMTRGILLSG
jgi:transposase